MVFPYSHIVVQVIAHGGVGILDEVGCFIGLFVVALAVVLVYGRDLIKPAAKPPTNNEAAAPQDKQET